MEYEHLQQEIEKGGYFAQVRRFENGFTDLVCNSARTASGRNHGNSFRVERGTKSNQWFITTWSPNYYRVLEPAQLPVICIALLTSSPRPLYKVEQESLERLKLEYVSEEDFFLHHGDLYETDA